MFRESNAKIGKLYRHLFKSLQECSPRNVDRLERWWIQRAGATLNTRDVPCTCTKNQMLLCKGLVSDVIPMTSSPCTKSLVNCAAPSQSPSSYKCLYKGNGR